jgi:hypothetical protein
VLSFGVGEIEDNQPIVGGRPLYIGSSQLLLTSSEIPTDLTCEPDYAVELRDEPFVVSF